MRQTYNVVCVSAALQVGPLGSGPCRKNGIHRNTVHTLFKSFEPWSTCEVTSSDIYVPARSVFLDLYETESSAAGEVGEAIMPLKQKSD